MLLFATVLMKKSLQEESGNPFSLTFFLWYLNPNERLFIYKKNYSKIKIYTNFSYK